MVHPGRREAGNGLWEPVQRPKNPITLSQNRSGHWYISPCPAPGISTSSAPGIAPLMIREFTGGTMISSVPVITSVGWRTPGRRENDPV